MDLKFWQKALREAERELDAATTRAALDAAAKKLMRSVQDIWNVFDKDDERLQLADPGHPALVQTCTRIFQECLGVASDLPEFGPADPGERLAWRASDHDVDRVLRPPEAQPGAHALGGDLGISQILRHRVTGAVRVEIAGMTGGGLRIGIETCQDRKAGALQPEGQAATPREKIEDTGRTPLLQPGNLRPDWLIRHG